MKTKKNKKIVIKGITVNQEEVVLIFKGKKMFNKIKGISLIISMIKLNFKFKININL